MVRYHDTLWCDGCGVEIHWKPFTAGRRSFCCLKCLQGEVCDCGSDLEDYHSVQKELSGAAIHPPLKQNG